VAAPSSIVIDSGETYRLRNDHPTDELVVKHEKRTFRVAAGKSALVPFEVIRVWWGDPRCRAGVFVKFSDSKEEGYVNKREAEIARLGVLYGTYAADVRSLNDPDWPMNSPNYGQPRRTPWPITVTNEAGEQIVPCGLDLSGEMVYSTIHDESRDLNDQVQYQEHLEARIDKLQEELRRVAGGGVEDDAEVDIPGR
jgi:hypothetical protein